MKKNVMVVLAGILLVLNFVSCRKNEEPAGPEISCFEFDKSEVKVKDRVLLKWTVYDADYVVINDGFSDTEYAPVSYKWYSFDTKGEKTFTLTAVNADGSVTKSATLNVKIHPLNEGPPVFFHFSSIDPVLPKGHVTTIGAHVDNVESAKIYGVNFINYPGKTCVNMTVNHKNQVWEGFGIRPVKTHTYKLVASNRYGSVTRYFTITVK